MGPPRSGYQGAYLHYYDTVLRHRSASDSEGCELQARLVLSKVPGGAEEIRTPDFLRAKEALFHLSYSPTASLYI